MKAKEIDAGIRMGLVSTQIEGKRTAEILCEHKEMDPLHYAHGLCRGCYDEVSSGIPRLGGMDLLYVFWPLTLVPF